MPDHSERPLVALLLILVTVTLYAQEQEYFRLQPDQVYRKIYDLKLSGKTTAPYWADTMRAGETQIINGVIHRKSSALNQRITPLSGSQARTLGIPPDELRGNIPGRDTASKRAFLQQRSSLADWIVDQRHSRLPRASQDTLRRHFHTISQQAAEIQLQAGEGRLSAEESQKRMAALMAKLLLAERNVYRPMPQLFRQRYGKGIDSVKEMPGEEDLSRMLLPFLNGKATAVRPVKSPPKPIRKAGAGEPGHLPRNLLVPPPGSVIQTIEYDEVPVEHVALEGRIFVAEHPVFESWEWGIVHSSIVAGIWSQKIERKILETRQITGAGSPGGSGPQVARASGGTVKLISKVRRTIRTWEFIDWIWANGCVGSYSDSDKLTLTERVCAEPANDVELLMRLMNSYLPDTEGDYCLNSATAYSLGLYGVNYVCHQSANAFMSSRRGYEPVSHWYSLLLYGLHGNIGTSSCSDREGAPMRGCIPGNWCEGNHTPYIDPAEEPIAALVESAAGDGYGLAIVWDPMHGWVASNAIYNNCPVTISPEADLPDVTEESLPVE